MKRVIWKYELGIATTLVMPANGQFLKVDLQEKAVCAWFLVDPEDKKVPRKFRIYGTGHSILDPDAKYLGTFQSLPFVWHLFEE